MTHFASSCVRPNIYSSTMQWGGMVLLTSFVVLAGLVPGLSRQSAEINWASAAFAQTTNQIQNYAGAVLEIEPLRRKAYQKVRRMMNGNVPSDVCRQDRLPNMVNSICANFFDESADIIRKNNLSIREFNDLTQRSQSDKRLMNEIQQELIRQQQR